jgi:hypothetical protein
MGQDPLDERLGPASVFDLSASLPVTVHPEKANAQ